MASVRLVGVVKRFGRTQALRGIDLEVRDGEVMVLLGPSGCGKTTTLRIVAGLERPDEGRVYFGERDVTHLPPRERNISMVFQSYAVWPHMKVYDNIAFPLKIKKVPEAEVRRRVKWAAELLQIEDLLDRYPHQLSGGQRQRVAVARAIVVEPEVLLMDEPLSNLDALLRVRMRSEIKKLQRRLGVTMIYVTHDQTEAMVIADRIAVMSQGMIMQVGTPEEVYEDPANTFVAGFIGSPSMNLLEAEARRRDGGSVIMLGGQEVVVPVEVDGRVIVGIRPERILFEPPEGSYVSLDAEVDFVENLGSDRVVHLRVDGLVLVARTTRSGVEQGSRVRVYVRVGDIKVFRVSGERVG